MGNSLAQINSQRSVQLSKTTLQYPILKKSNTLRDYTRGTSLIASCINNTNTRRTISFSKPRSTVPTDAEIIDIHALRCKISTSDIDEGEMELLKQLNYIRSCVRKDKGLFGK